jgi:hypothetical protein
MVLFVGRVFYFLRNEFMTFQKFVTGFDGVNFITELVEDVLKDNDDKVKLILLAQFRPWFILGFFLLFIFVASNLINEIKLIFLVCFSIRQDLTTLHDLCQKGKFKFKIGYIEVSFIIVSSDCLEHQISAGEKVTLHV